MHALGKLYYDSATEQVPKAYCKSFSLLTDLLLHMHKLALLFINVSI